MKEKTFLLLLELRSAFCFKTYCLHKFGIRTPLTPRVCIRVYCRSNMLILAEMLVTYFKMGYNNTNSCNSFAFLHRNDVVHSETNKHLVFFYSKYEYLLDR